MGTKSCLFLIPIRVCVESEVAITYEFSEGIKEFWKREQKKGVIEFMYRLFLEGSGGNGGPLGKLVRLAGQDPLDHALRGCGRRQ